MEQTLRRIDLVVVITVVDQGYNQRGREEMDFFFTFLAERYELRRVMITNKVVFSQP